MEADLREKNAEDAARGSKSASARDDPSALALNGDAVDDRGLGAALLESGDGDLIEAFVAGTFDDANGGRFALGYHGEGEGDPRSDGVGPDTAHGIGGGSGPVRQGLEIAAPGHGGGAGREGAD